MLAHKASGSGVQWTDNHADFGLIGNDGLTNCGAANSDLKDLACKIEGWIVTPRMVRTELLALRAEGLRHGWEFPLDVRLQVTSEGFAVHHGTPDYDIDHDGVWAEGTLDRRGDTKALAVYLCVQAADQAADGERCWQIHFR
jgi:hypothetical protein